MNIKRPSAHKERRRRRQAAVCSDTCAALTAVLCLQPHRGEIQPLLLWPVKHLYDQPCCWSPEYEYTCFLFAVALYLPMLHPSLPALCIESMVSPSFFSSFLSWSLLTHGDYTQSQASGSPGVHNSLSLELKPFSVIASVSSTVTLSWQGLSLSYLHLHYLNAPSTSFWTSPEYLSIFLAWFSGLEWLSWESLSITCSYFSSQSKLWNTPRGILSALISPYPTASLACRNASVPWIFPDENPRIFPQSPVSEAWMGIFWQLLAHGPPYS